jgi:hypothetical protein
VPGSLSLALRYSDRFMIRLPMRDTAVNCAYRALPVT